MTEALTDDQARAWRNYTDIARRSGAAFALPKGDPATQDDLKTTVQELEGSIAKALDKANRQVAEARETMSTRKGGVDVLEEAAWRRLEEGCRKVESDLRTPSSLRTRLDEGRRSLMPKIERLVRERLEPVVRRDGKRLEASLNPEGLAELRQELPSWVNAWALYVCRWVDVDLGREIETAWSPREGGLPLSPPQLSPLQPPDLRSEINFPEITVGRDLQGVASGIARHARSILYGLMSLTFLFGVSRTDLPVWVYAAALFGTVAYGYVLASQERGKDRERLEQELRQKADSATWDAVRIWLDRSQDRLIESVRGQLHDRRHELVSWYRREVIPRREERRREEEDKQARAEKLRLELPKIQEQQRNLQRVQSQLALLQSALKR